MLKYFLSFFLTIASVQADVLPPSQTKKLIDDLYSNVRPYLIEESEAQAITEKGGDPTYGEITFEGIQKLIKLLNIDKNDVFYDLGCGTGKPNVQIYLSIPLKKSIGIELSKTRFQTANSILEHLRNFNLIDNNRLLRFIEGNILDINFSDGTVFYISSLCFPDALMKNLGEKLALLPTGVRIISLTKFPDIPRLKFKRENLIPMSWNEKGASAYLYEIENEEKA